MVEEKLSIELEANAKGVKTGVDEAKRNIKSLENTTSSSANKMSATLGKLGKLFAKTFAIAKIVQFNKVCIDSANKTSNAWIGLNSILTGKTGTNEAFQEAKAFIEDYVKDGLVPLNNAVASYKNLALRGYTSNQIAKTMEALKNSATFARQSTYSLGEAVQTATEGLKNENSIVVDNAGVTKNVAKMWEDYAKSIGKSTNQLTQAEKIIAEVNGIQEETKFQMNDSKYYALTYSGAIARITTAFTNMKTSIGNVLQPLVKMLTPTIEKLINYVTKLFNSLSALLGLFGFKTDLDIVSDKISASASNTEKLADGLEEVGDSAIESGKKAKRGLASFDEITNLADNTSGGSSIDIGSTLAEIEEANVEISKIDSKLENAFNSVDLEPLQKSLEELKKALEPFKENVGNGLKWLYNNVLKPIGQWTITDLIPNWISALANAFNFLNVVLEYFKPIWQVTWNSFFKPIYSFNGGVIVTTLQGIRKAFEVLTKALESNKENWYNFINGVSAKMLTFQNENISPLIQALSDLFNNVVELVQQVVMPVLKTLYEFVKPMIKDYNNEVTNLGKTIISNITNTLATILNVTTSIIKVLNGLIIFLTGAFTGDWNKAWDGLKLSFETIWDANASIVKKGVNLIIGFINKMISGTETAINNIINMINTLRWEVPEWVPIIGGETFGFDFPKKHFTQIPMLAKGGVVNNPTLAMIGEKGKEAVVPLENNTEWLDEIASRLFVMMNSAKGLSNDSITINVPVEVDGKQFANATIKDLNLEAIRRGYKPILSV